MAALEDLINLAGIAILEEMEIGAQVVRKFHKCLNPLEDMSDKHFIKMFRLNKNMAIDLITLLEPYILPPTRSSGLSVSRKVLTALRFFASGSYQMDIGININMAISQASVSKIITEVTDALNRPEIFNRFVKFPRTIEQLQQIRTAFYERHQFPGVIGCIDCTHVAIFPPHIDDPIYPEAAYVNRKNYHSLNVQLICDSSLKFLNVCARFPGSSHDSFIWNLSNVLPVLRQLHENGNNSFLLLGDSGYALRPWLLTPLANPEPHTPEAAYNERHMSTRSIIERCNGVLKLRFRCLLKHRVLHYAPERAAKIINSCTILHNMCIDYNLPEVRLDPGEELGDFDFGIYDAQYVDRQGVGVARVNPDLAAGRQLQQQIIRHHFVN